MSNVKFISTVYLKERTTIEDNVDDNKLVPFIYKAQEIYLQQAVGTTFYEHLKTAVANGTLTADETTLLRNYVQPMVAEWAQYEALPFISNKLTNKSISQENSEFSTPSDLNTLKYLRNGVRDMAEFYTKRLVKYLCDNSSMFPVYNNPDANENLSKSSKSYFGGVYLPKKKASGIRSVNDPSDDCNC